MSTIKMSAKDWNSISVKEQNAITEILRKSELISKSTTITGDDSIRETVKSEGFFCDLACETAATLAHTACNLLSGTAKSVCNIAANTAEQVCKAAC